MQSVFRNPASFLSSEGGGHVGGGWKGARGLQGKPGEPPAPRTIHSQAPALCASADITRQPRNALRPNRKTSCASITLPNADGVSCDSRKGHLVGVGKEQAQPRMKWHEITSTMPSWLSVSRLSPGSRPGLPSVPRAAEVWLPSLLRTRGTSLWLQNSPGAFLCQQLGESK